MKSYQVCAALLGLAILGACKAPETTSRMDSGNFPISISATRDLREPAQSLAIVAMKDSLAPGESLEFTPRARQVLAAYGN
ncbi:MAG: hypothetical protein Q8K20_04700 [Gemmobacter sp.]|nr:hypothetical protein [Gemmobacter sp.]